MKKPDFSRWLDNKQLVAIVSVFIAIIAWAVVVVSISPQKTTVIKKIPVNLEYNAIYKNLDLDVVADSDLFVDIVVTGPRNVVGGLSSADFIIYPQYASVEGPGTYELPLRAEKTNTLAEFDIVSIQSPTIEIRLDKFITKKFIVETDLSEIRVAEGYIKGKGYASPAEVTLTGPEQEMNTVSKVVAKVQLPSEQTNSTISTVALEIYDKNENLLPQMHIQFDAQQVEVTAPVLKMKEIPLTVGFINVPMGFDTATLSYSLSAPTINLAGPGADIDKYEKWEIGYIDLQSFEVGKEYTFEIELPAAFENLDNLTSVTATFKEDALSTRTITATDVRVINAPEDYNIEVQTNRIYSVKLIGPAEVLNGLSPTSVVAQINAADITVEKGQQTVPVQIVTPSSDAVFATGSYTVLVNITAR